MHLTGSFGVGVHDGVGGMKNVTLRDMMLCNVQKKLSKRSFKANNAFFDSISRHDGSGQRDMPQAALPQEGPRQPSGRPQTGGALNRADSTRFAISTPGSVRAPVPQTGHRRAPGRPPGRSGQATCRPPAGPEGFRAGRRQVDRLTGPTVPGRPQASPNQASDRPGQAP